MTNLLWKICMYANEAVFGPIKTRELIKEVPFWLFIIYKKIALAF